jgi:DNA-directed RNA polymerase III subunit RPC6
MCAELEPSREITGGAWYTANEFDAEFIGVLQALCARYLAERGGGSVAEVTEHIARRGVSKVPLEEADVRMILDTLVFDGRAESVDDARYRPAVQEVPASTAVTTVPCGTCPVFSECKDGGPISPQSCVYWKAWLDAQF